MNTSSINILVINANPKTTGTLSSILKRFSDALLCHGVKPEVINLIQNDINDCLGCMDCIRTGNCAVKDDMDTLIRKMRMADGYIIGSSIRDNYTTALFKRFCERTSYLLGFTRDLYGKPVVGVATVGYMGGKKEARNLLTMKNCGAKEVGFLYEKVGFEKRIKNTERLKLKVDNAIDALLREINKTRKTNRQDSRLRLTDFFFGIFISKMKIHLPYIYETWEKKGWIK